LDVEVEYVNLEAVPRPLGRDMAEPAFSLNWGPNVSSEDANKGIPQEIIWRRDGQNEHHPTSKLKLPPGGGYTERRSGVDWAAVKSAYFVVAFKPEFEGAIGWVVGMPLHFRLGVGAPRMELAPGEAQQRLFRVYLGPTQKASLNKAWADLDSVMQFFTMFAFMDTFAKLLLGILNWFYHNLIPNYGLAIIFLTVLVRVVVFPLTLSGMKNMKRMQKLAPEMERIKAEVGDNQQEVQKRMMEMYRERGVSPLGGCFPLLLQMPVFFALYRMLWSAFELRRAPFMLWINDLSEPDRLLELPFAIPIPFTESGIDSLNLLPILMGVAMVASMKLTPTSGPIQNPQQKMMMTLMPVLFSVICYNMASGLNLYILVSTLLGIAQNYAVHLADIDVELKKKKPITRPRHFYSAAQARKREIAKEIRKEKKRKRLSPEARQKRDQDRKP
ncbi:MAG TPA: membrane protein insertase YidC, partial [Candidatus Hydrogenedentes bacterium]|nr:membrane protein insertase YidC [Candidatus Hydrogenedentota bacterium]